MPAALLTQLVLLASPAWACPECAAGDPTLAVVGTERPTAGQVRLATDVTWRGTREAAPDGTWHGDDLRLGLGVAWAPHDRVILTASLPFGTRSYTSPSLASERGIGLGDMTVGTRVVAVRVDQGDDAHLAGLSAGLELPTALRVRRDGTPASEDVQLGSGAWTPTAGLWYGLWWRSLHVFTSANGRVSAGGWDGHRPGAGGTGTVTVQVQPIPEVAPRLGFDVRGTLPDRDVSADEDLPGTGGWLLQVTPGLAVAPGRGVLLLAQVGVPVFQSVAGVPAGAGERELPSPRLGVSLDL